MKRTRNLIVLLVALAAIVGIAVFAAHRGGGETIAVKMQRIVPARRSPSNFPRMGL